MITPNTNLTITAEAKAAAPLVQAATGSKSLSDLVSRLLLRCRTFGDSFSIDSLRVGAEPADEEAREASL